MNDDTWERLWNAFHAALERPAGERAAFVAAVCGDDAGLRGELESLLAAHLEAGEGPATAAHGPALEMAGPAVHPVGESIGPYRVRRILGAGGMGVVYEAEQERPIRRRVALKLVPLGMDTGEVLARFASERQALALMSHPNIARVLDADATPEGRPYFAMELVEGEPITDFCDARSLGIRQRLELFLPVCRAVEHAHQKGIIHRDLKPSNVLVATVDGVAVPKVIDFGIAKALHHPLTGGTLATRGGWVLGTPAYMSPEQAAMSPDVDTRADIHALGALLYELLTGSPPFDAGDVPPEEVLRRVREDDAAPPSARVGAGSSGAGEPSCRDPAAARQRRRELQGELDWIVLKALEKERGRRYASASELAADLERHLTDQPVLARPPTLAYRLRKAVRRHRVEAGAAAVVLLALVGFGAVMALQSFRLSRALETAERERATATRVTDLLVHLFEQTDPANARGEETTVRQALDDGAGRIGGELAGEPEIRATLHETIGRVYSSLGLYDPAAEQIEAALALRSELFGGEHHAVAAALQRLGEVELSRGRRERAGELAESVLALRRRLGSPPADLAESLDLLAVVRREGGDLRGAQSLHEEALALRRSTLAETDSALGTSWNLLGIVRRQLGDYEGAEAAYRQAMTIFRASLGEDHPDVAMVMNNLALLLHVRGKHRDSGEMFAELVPLRRRLLGDTHPDLAITLANQAKLLHDMRDFGGAEQVYAEALAAGRASLGDEHPQVANMLADLGGVLAKSGRFDEALAAEHQALAIRRRALAEGHYSFAGSAGYLAQIHAARGAPATAEPLFADAVELYRRSVGEHPWTAAALVAQGLFLVDLGRAGEAEPLLREAVAMQERSLPAGDRRTAVAASALGDCLTRLGRFAEAERLLLASIDDLTVPETPETAEARERLAALYRAAGREGSPPEVSSR